jgi:hypothetical protein
MNKAYVVYNLLTGEVSKCVQCLPETIEFQLAEGEAFVEGTVDSVAYWVPSASLGVTPRPILQIKKEGAVLKGIPKGASLSIEGVDYVCDGTPVELSFRLPGVNEITVNQWPYMPWSCQYENTP